MLARCSTFGSRDCRVEEARMKLAEGVVAGLLLLTFSPIAATAQTDSCPKGTSNDDCDRWRIERADQALSEALESRIAERSKLTTNPLVAEAVKQTAMEAHRAWLVFRDAACRAYVAESFISAMTERAKNASCVVRLTERRIAELKRP
jgi:uncharacterized protein YecT (DUF1311 family)